MSFKEIVVNNSFTQIIIQIFSHAESHSLFFRKNYGRLRGALFDTIK